jgi:hypothetical protein
MSDRKCPCHGTGFGWKEPMYYCSVRESVYHWNCLDKTFFSNPQCPYKHGYEKLRRMDQ